MTVYDANLDLYFYENQDEWGRLRLLRAKMMILGGSVRQKSRQSPLQAQLCNKCLSKIDVEWIKECLTD